MCNKYDIYIKISTLVLMFLYIAEVNSKTIYDIPYFANMEIDSVLVTTMPEECFFSLRITRDNFDKYSNICKTNIIHSKYLIDSILKELQKCIIDSVLPCDSKTLTKRLSIRHMKDRIYFYWINDDSVDIRCRVILYSKETFVVIWMSDTGILDVDKYRCSNGEKLMKYLRELQYSII